MSASRPANNIALQWGWARSPISRLGLGLMLLGSALALLAFFLPWLHTLPVIGRPDIPTGDYYSPLTMLLKGYAAFGLLFGGAVLSILVADDRALRPRRPTFLPLIMSIASAAAGIAISLFIPTGLRFALAFGWPSYTTTPDWGQQVAIAGFIGCALGAVLLLATITVERR
ncbi:MAG: hypothetical protein ACXWQ5_18415 [Ktedonobacterales bacterium]